MQWFFSKLKNFLLGERGTFANIWHKINIFGNLVILYVPMIQNISVTVRIWRYSNSNSTYNLKIQSIKRNKIKNISNNIEGD